MRVHKGERKCRDHTRAQVHLLQICEREKRQSGSAAIRSAGVGTVMTNTATGMHRFSLAISSLHDGCLFRYKRRGRDPRVSVGGPALTNADPKDAETSKLARDDAVAGTLEPVDAQEGLPHIHRLSIT